MPKNASGNCRTHRSRTGVFFRSFLRSPKQVASILPSSRFLVKKVVEKMDLDGPRVIAEFGPGEGVHAREILRRAHPESRLLLFELNRDFCKSLREEFSHDPRVEVLNTDCCKIIEEAKERGITGFDYIFSGIPFSLMDPMTKQQLMLKVHEALLPDSDFIIYQTTNELKRYATHFDKLNSEWVAMNFPPMFVTVYHKNGLTAQPEPDRETA